MGGGAKMDELPRSYGYRGYPRGERRSSVYNSSFPGWRRDNGGYYDDPSLYDGGSVPMFEVESPFTDSLARKRNGNGLRRAPSSGIGQHGNDVQIEDGVKTDVAKSRYSAVPVVEKSAPNRRVISIPVTSGKDVEDNSVKSPVTPKEGTRNSKAAMPANRAAVVIQSWYRGHLVRSTTPLKHLRTIATVRLQLKELDERVSDAVFMNYARENSERRATLTEYVMNLLLQLDAIQGAHPDVRAVRKVASKEVIHLQERVDDLLSNNTAVVQPEQISMEVEATSPETLDRESTSIDARELLSDSSKSSFVATDKMDGTIVEDETSIADVDSKVCEEIELEGEIETLAAEPSMGETNEVEHRHRMELHLDQEFDLGKKLDHGETTSNAVTEVDDVKMIVTTQDAMKSIESTSCCGLEASNLAERAKNPREQVTPLQESEADSGDECTASEHDADIHPLNVKFDYSPKEYSSLPQSPKSPFEGLASLYASNLNALTSLSDSELYVERSPEKNQNASIQGNIDNNDLLVKLSEDNRVLKSLLVDAMRWNQSQASTMYDVRNRLGNLESRMSPRSGKKWVQNSRRKAGKSSKMDF